VDSRSRADWPAIHWAFTKPDKPVPIPVLASNVTWNPATNMALAVALGVAVSLKLWQRFDQRPAESEDSVGALPGTDTVQ